MLCPSCLNDVRRFEQQPAQDGPGVVHLCPECGDVVPNAYVNHYDDYTPVVFSIIGNRGHGKTLFVSSLFYAIIELDLTKYWPDFTFLTLNEHSLDTVYELVGKLREGDVPPSTPKVFPTPTLIHMEGIPLQRNPCTLFYDTSGEAFRRAPQIERYASFVRRARTALFLVSIPRIVKDGKDINQEMHTLLTSYVLAMAGLGDIRRQHLLVVYTFGDELVPHLEALSQG